MREVTGIVLWAAVWAGGASAVLGGPFATLAAFAALVTAAAFGVGYEMEDAGAAAALFLLLALASLLLAATVAVSGANGATLTVVFATLPALLAAVSAYAGGRRRERCR